MKQVNLILKLIKLLVAIKSNRTIKAHEKTDENIRAVIMEYFRSQRHPKTDA